MLAAHDTTRCVYHDVGAGGLSNIFPIDQGGGCGGVLTFLNAIRAARPD